MTLQMLEQVIVLARQTGAEIMRIYAQEDVGTTSKADNSPLTLADLASHRAIEAGLLKITPPFPILSEEAANIPYAERKDWRTFWLVNPLGGTKEFIKRKGEFTINIALIEDGIPSLARCTRRSWVYLRLQELDQVLINTNQTSPHSCAATLCWRAYEGGCQPFA